MQAQDQRALGPQSVSLSAYISSSEVTIRTVLFATHRSLDAAALENSS